MKKFTVSEDTEVVLNGKHMLLESGDEIVLEATVDMEPIRKPDLPRHKHQSKYPSPGKPERNEMMARRKMKESGYVDPDEDKDEEYIPLDVGNTTFGHFEVGRRQDGKIIVKATDGGAAARDLAVLEPEEWERLQKALAKDPIKTDHPIWDLINKIKSHHL